LEDHGEFVVAPPKSEYGYRDIYLTDTAMEILNSLPKTGIYVFKPRKRAIYNMQLKRICTSCGLEPLSIHKLRHSFATRCVESGMKPKTLQKILGHSDVTITLNYYVHVGDDEMAREMEKFSGYQMDTNIYKTAQLCV
jgi:integrase